MGLRSPKLNQLLHSYRWCMCASFVRMQSLVKSSLDGDHLHCHQNQIRLLLNRVILVWIYQLVQEICIFANQGYYVHFVPMRRERIGNSTIGVWRWEIWCRLLLIKKMTFKCSFNRNNNIYFTKTWSVFSPHICQWDIHAIFAGIHPLVHKINADKKECRDHRRRQCYHRQPKYKIPCVGTCFKILFCRDYLLMSYRKRS